MRIIPIFDASEIAAQLDQLAKVTGDRRFSRAARALAGPQGGRPAVDDRALLSEVAELIATKRARSIRAATMMVAVAYFPICPEAAADRLRRKYRYFGTK